jgi:hypothetical protein
VSRGTNAGFCFRKVLAGDVVGKRCLSPSTIISAASRALSVLTVFDEPHGGVRKPAGSVILGFA